MLRAGAPEIVTDLSPNQLIEKAIVHRLSWVLEIHIVDNEEER